MHINSVFHYLVMPNKAGRYAACLLCLSYPFSFPSINSESFFGLKIFGYIY